MTIENKQIGEYTDTEFKENVSTIEQYVVDDFLNLVEVIHNDTIHTVYKDCIKDNNLEEMQNYLEVHRDVLNIQMITNDPDEDVNTNIWCIIDKTNSYIQHVQHVQNTITVKGMLDRYNNMISQLIQFVVRVDKTF